MDIEIYLCSTTPFLIRLETVNLRNNKHDLALSFLVHYEVIASGTGDLAYGKT